MVLLLCRIKNMQCITTFTKIHIQFVHKGWIKIGLEICRTKGQWTGKRYELHNELHILHSSLPFYWHIGQSSLMHQILMLYIKRYTSVVKLRMSWIRYVVQMSNEYIQNSVVKHEKSHFRNSDVCLSLKLLNDTISTAEVNVKLDSNQVKSIGI